MNKIKFIIFFILLSISGFGQVKSYFGGTLNIYGSSGTSPEYTIQGFFNDTSGEYPLDSVAVGDIIYVSEGSTCVRLRVDTINSSAGGILNADVYDVDTILLSPPNGIGALMRETSNSNLPRYVSGLSETLLSCIRTHMTGKVDEEFGINGDLKEALVIDTTISSISYVADLTDVAELRVITDLSAASSNITIEVPDPTINIGKKVTVKQINPTGSFATQVTVNAIGNRIRLPGQTILTNVLNIPAGTENEYGFTTAYDENSGTYMWVVIEPNAVYSETDGLKFYDPQTTSKQKIKRDFDVATKAAAANLIAPDGANIIVGGNTKYIVQPDTVKYYVTDEDKVITLPSGNYAVEDLSWKRKFSSIKEFESEAPLLKLDGITQLLKIGGTDVLVTASPFKLALDDIDRDTTPDGRFIKTVELEYPNKNFFKDSGFPRTVGTTPTIVQEYNNPIIPYSKARSWIGDQSYIMFGSETTLSAGDTVCLSYYFKPISVASSSFDIAGVSATSTPPNVPLDLTATEYKRYYHVIVLSALPDRVRLNFSNFTSSDTISITGFQLERGSGPPTVLKQTNGLLPADRDKMYVYPTGEELITKGVLDISKISRNTPVSSTSSGNDETELIQSAIDFCGGITDGTEVRCNKVQLGRGAYTITNTITGTDYVVIEGIDTPGNSSVSNDDPEAHGTLININIPDSTLYAFDFSPTYNTVINRSGLRNVVLALLDTTDIVMHTKEVFKCEFKNISISGALAQTSDNFNIGWLDEKNPPSDHLFNVFDNIDIGGADSIGIIIGRAATNTWDNINISRCLHTGIQISEGVTINRLTIQECGINGVHVTGGIARIRNIYSEANGSIDTDSTFIFKIDAGASLKVSESTNFSASSGGIASIGEGSVLYLDNIGVIGINNEVRIADGGRFVARNVPGINFLNVITGSRDNVILENCGGVNYYSIRDSVFGLFTGMHLLDNGTSITNSIYRGGVSENNAYTSAYGNSPVAWMDTIYQVESIPTVETANGKYSGGVYADGWVYMAPEDVTDAIRFNPSTNEIESFSVPASGSDQYRGVVSANNKVFFIPYTQANMLEIDLTDRSQTEYALGTGYNGAVAVGKYLFIAPGTDSTNIVKWNTHTNSVESRISVGSGYNNPVYDSRYVYFPSVNSSQTYIVRVDPITDDTSHINIIGNQRQFSGMQWDGQYLYAIPWNDGSSTNNVPRYNPTTKEWDVFTTLQRVSGFDYSGSCFDGYSIWVVPLAGATAIAKINPKTGDIFELIPPGANASFQGVVYANGYVVVIPRNADEIIKIRPPELGNHAVRTGGDIELGGSIKMTSDQRGTATVTGVDGGQTTASITFTNTKDDATYYVATSVSINTGTPSGDELRVVVANKATTGFDLILQDGLEGGEVVDMDWILIE